MQDFWISSVVLYSRGHSVSETESVEVTSVGPVTEVSFFQRNPWSKYFAPPQMRTGTDPNSGTLYSLETLDPSIPTVIHRRRSPWECNYNSMLSSHGILLPLEILNVIYWLCFRSLFTEKNDVKIVMFVSVHFELFCASCALFRINSATLILRV